MVQFDESTSKATLKLSLGNVSVPVTIDLFDLSTEPVLGKSLLQRLDLRRRRAFLEYADACFKLDKLSPVPWRDQFCTFLAKESDRILSLPVKVSSAELRELMDYVRNVRRQLVADAGVHREEFGEALCYQYHDGFNHLTRDDDFFAVFCGNRIVSIIPLPGNDYNELKKFLMAGSDQVLSPENVVALHKAVMEMRKSKLAKLAKRRFFFSKKKSQGVGKM